ncbi:MAG: hypothetical protein K6A64_00145 [Bacteroidales bacterium]|nr:hypothetical protein [Bacteroidales bacterium]
MKRMLLFGACALAILACNAVVTPTGPKGDLAFFELRGNVKSLEEAGAEYNFDKDGKLIIDPEDGTVEISSEEGNTCYTYTPVNGEDPFAYWGPIRPFKRVYDKNGTLRSVAYHYEMNIDLYYNEDGTVSREDWGEERWGGCNFYNYLDGMRTTAVNHSGDVASTGGVLEEEVFWDDFVCYTYDECGNWISRFTVTHYNGRVYGSAGRRKIEYYSKDVPATRPHALEGLVLTGTIGADADMCLVDFDNEYYGPNGLYQLEGDGVELRIVEKIEYDKASGHLIMQSSRHDGTPIGTFDGTLTNSPGKSRYVGTFTNVKGHQVSFDLSEK